MASQLQSVMCQLSFFFRLFTYLMGIRHLLSDLWIGFPSAFTSIVDDFVLVLAMLESQTPNIARKRKKYC